MRFRLRTLLILVAVLPALIAAAWWWIDSFRASGGTTINGSQVVICTSEFFGGFGLSSDGKSATVNFGTQPVLVDAQRIEIVGKRTVSLPASWAKVELIRSGKDVQVVLDGSPLK